MEETFDRLSLLIQSGDRVAFVAFMEQMLEGELRYDIDYQEPSSKNSLIHVAAQNGNKLMAKNLLRNGANINAINGRGNSPLHFCFAYGYQELGEYLISLGADDSMLNADGLSCYEGLNKEDLDQL